MESAATDHEGHDRDEDGRGQCFHQVVLRNREADRKCIDRGGDALHRELPERKLRIRLLDATLLSLRVPHPLQQHAAADVAEKNQRDPRNQLLKGLKVQHDRVD